MRFCLLTLLAFFIAFMSGCSTKKKKKSGDEAPATADSIEDEDRVGEDDKEDRVEKVEGEDNDDEDGDDDDEGDRGIRLGGNLGCVQGRVENGETRKPIDKAEVYVHVSGQVVKGEEQTNIDGEYYLCGIPVDESFPIFAKKAGHLEFQSYISVSSSVASATAQADKDIVKPKPTAIGNIRMYALDGDAADLTVHVSYLGASLTGAKVRLKPVGTNIFDQDATFNAEAVSTFLAPKNDYYENIEVETDAAGNAVFEKANLVFGGRYSYVVIPPAASGASVGRGLATVGEAENNQTSAYTSRIGLVGGDSSVEAISTNALSAGIGAAGPIRIAFSHQIQAPADIAPAAIAATTTGFPAAVTRSSFTFTTTDDDFVLVITPAYLLDDNDAAGAVTAAASPDAGFVIPVDAVQAKAPGQGAVSLIGTAEAPGLFFGKTVKLFD